MGHVFYSRHAQVEVNNQILVGQKQFPKKRFADLPELQGKAYDA